MINNRKYLLIGTIYLAVLEVCLFVSFGLGSFIFFHSFLAKGSVSLATIVFGVWAGFFSLFGIALSYFIFFLTIGKIYKKFKADFNFKHPVLYTSIVIFILGNILFYIAMLIWSSVM